MRLPFSILARRLICPTGPTCPISALFPSSLFSAICHLPFAICHRAQRFPFSIFHFPLLLLCLSASAQTNPPPPTLDQKLTSLNESIDFAGQRLNKTISDLVWFQRMQDIAVVDKIRYVGPPPRQSSNNPSLHPSTNGVIISAYTFLPRRAGSPSPLNGGRASVRGEAVREASSSANAGGRGEGASPKFPLIVLLHTEVHGDFNPDDDFRVARELIEQGYAVVAPDYRGSTGYGGDFWRLIDYGGLEIDDVFLSRQWMLDHHSNIDSNRVGIVGWSHGGMIALMNIFFHPSEYAVAYAGMPVTDLVFRLRNKPPGYRELFSAPYHIGKTLEEDPDEYLRRSPLAHAHLLKTPLLIHAVTNDEDVSPDEVERLVSVLRSEKKDFQYKVYTNAPSGHAFNKLDTAEAQASRREIYSFLAKYLKPPNPLP
jgi:dienelactone hydrolase